MSINHAKTPTVANSLTDWRTRIISALDHKAVLDTRSIFHELNPHLQQSPIFNQGLDNYRAAAVLVPIIDRPAEPTVLLTLRSNDMPSHAGQISFPGGSVADADHDRAATALRETEEEVGISPKCIEVVGDMGTHFGGMGFAVTPVVGIIHPDANFSLCPREVQEVFEVPFSYLLDQSNHIIEERQNGEVKYRMPAISYEQYHIWGLTAGIINSLVKAMASWEA